MPDPVPAVAAASAGGPSGNVTVPVAGVYTQDQIAAAITGAESSFLPGIIQSGVDYCGAGADRAGWGLWQITCGNSVPQFGTDFQLLDPWNNAEAAVTKYDEAGGFSPWTTYTTGAYLQYLQHTSADTQLTDPGEYMQINATPPGTPASPPPDPGSTDGPPMPGGGASSLGGVRQRVRRLDRGERPAILARLDRLHRPIRLTIRIRKDKT